MQMPAVTDYLEKQMCSQRGQNKTEGNKRHIGLISTVKGESRERKPRFSWHPVPIFWFHSSQW